MTIIDERHHFSQAIKPYIPCDWVLLGGGDTELRKRLASTLFPLLLCPLPPFRTELGEDNPEAATEEEEEEEDKEEGEEGVEGMVAPSPDNKCARSSAKSD